VTNVHFGSDIPPAAYYRYSPDRKGIHAQALLGGCRASFMPMATPASIGCISPPRRTARRR